MGKIVLNDLDFCLAIKQVTGVIRAEQGVPVFHSEEDGIVAPIPCFISAEFYDTEVSAYMYVGTNQLLLEPQVDDVMVDDLTGEDVAVNESYDELQFLMEEQKIRLVPKALMFSAISAMGVVLALIIAALLFFKFVSFKPLFLLDLIPIVAGGLGVRYYGKILDQTTIYDRNGNWVNLTTGETSLGEGFRLPIEH